MAKLIGPDFIALQVRDLKASERFYTERLGLIAASHSTADAIVFETKPIPFAIRRPLVDLDASKHLGWGVSLWIACDDADSLHSKLVEIGVPIIASLADGPFGQSFAFRDPDGYAVTVHSMAATK